METVKNVKVEKPKPSPPVKSSKSPEKKKSKNEIPVSKTAAKTSIEVDIRI